MENRQKRRHLGRRGMEEEGGGARARERRERLCSPQNKNSQKHARMYVTKEERGSEEKQGG